MMYSQFVAAAALLSLGNCYSSTSNDIANWGITQGSTCACGFLAAQFPSQVLVASRNSTQYIEEATHYYDTRVDLSPKCIFLPEVAEDVVAGVKILKSCRSQFAVRGAGHMSFIGAANTEGGVLVALTNMNEIVYNEKDFTVEAGPANTWYTMATALVPHGRMVIGGRLKTIGVSGLTLGGGYHYFNNKYGFAMDNVAGYDVVTGNGQLLRANATNNADLFWALKGGLSNFGIVTKFILNTHDVPLVTSTLQIYTEAAVPAFIKAVVDKARHILDPVNPIGSGAVMMIQVNASTGAVSPEMFGIQEGAFEVPEEFANFTAIPSVFKQTGITDAATWAAKFDTPYQTQRMEFGAHTMAADTDAVMAAFAIYKAGVAELADVPGVYPTFVLQELSVSGQAVAENNGIGNVWGLKSSEGAKIVWQLSTQWQRAEDDEKVLAWSQNITEAIHAANIARGVAFDFVYCNDAASYQKPFETIPAENLKKMKSIRAKYDKDLVFRKLSNGGFKLD